MFETGAVPILLSLPQMRIFGMTIELDPKGDKIKCPAFGLYSPPAEYSTMGHIVLDLTSLAYQPKSRELSAHPKRHVTGEDDDEPLVCPDRTAVTEDEDDQPPLWCNLHQEKNQ